jgi:hypothetical protein
VIMLLVKRRIGVIAISIIPPVVGLLVAWHMLGGSLRELALDPLAVAKLAMGPGGADIMTPLEILLRKLGVSPDLTFSIPSMLGLFAAAVAAVWIGLNRRMDERIQFAVALIFTMICLKHVIYDFVVLVVPVAAAVMAPKSKARVVVLLCAFHFWFLTPIVHRFYPGLYALEFLIYAFLLLVMGIATSRLYPTPGSEVAETVAAGGWSTKGSLSS